MTAAARIRCGGPLRSISRSRARQPKNHAADLREGQGLVQKEPSERHGGRRTEESQRGDEGGIPPREAPKPQGVAQSRARQSEPGQSQQISFGRDREGRLEDQDRRKEQQAARRQLTGGEGKQWDWKAAMCGATRRRPPWRPLRPNPLRRRQGPASRSASESAARLPRVRRAPPKPKTPGFRS